MDVAMHTSTTGNVATSSFLVTTINMMGLLIGLGQLSTAYALQNGGWVSGFLLLGLGVLGGYTSHLLGLCLAARVELRNYSDIGYSAFGKTGRLISLIFVNLESFMALVSCTISMNDNLTRVLEGSKLHISLLNFSTPHTLTVTAILISIPTVWLINLDKISFISTLNILLSVSICITFLCTAIFGGVKAIKPIHVFQIENILSVSGLYIFNIASHMAIPEIYRSMRDPSTFTVISFLSFGMVTALYATLAFLGAKMFGPEVSSQVTLSMPKHLIFTKIALWAATVIPMTKYVFFTVPMASEIERRLPSSMSFKRKVFIRCASGSLLLIIVLILSLTVPYFDCVLGLTGSLVSIFVSVILPCAFYLKIFRRTISRPSLVSHLSIITVSFLVGAMGTISTARSLVKTL
ncbi:hypothetical protein MKX01_003318 [Papaver californicum]|nr:hypothetical protein MKX01_003318 [Papaver californicum]